MKKLLLLLILPFFCFSQEIDEKKINGEIKSNLFDLVVGKSLNIGYEHFLNGNQAIQFDVTMFDTYSYIDAGYIDKNNLVGLQASYNIYFSKNKEYHGFSFYPFLKFRTGKQIVEDYYYNYDPITDTYSEQSREFDLTGLDVGFGLGHKWLFNNKISLGLGAQLGRNISDDKEFRDNYSDLNFKANVSLGIRF
jgi:hypothetical protein